MKTICIDLDGTICSKASPYTDAKPHLKFIKIINQLYDDGNTIIIWTARSGKIEEELSRTQLREWNIKYHELLLGKKQADIYLDDKAISAEELLRLFGEY